MIKINLGCGQKYLKGFINTELNKSVKADLYFNLNKFPYPFRNSYATYILMDNVLEHLDNVIKVMQEIHRILKPNGMVKIIVPYFKSDGAYQDPTHKHFFTEKSMDYFSYSGEYNYYTKSRFKILKKEISSSNSTALSKLRYIIPLKSILRYFLFNMFDQLIFELRAIKK
ncbi:hypothetical protein A2767_01830 [Candidatus Roizmanbacteria bacterium RIFCSPHIGHO2_01_FULL_35_10]|nr:MAG: hypothetical protein A2767_01830 [Candidatus Roizmanbacteria bacterium RIFCSPHIGHO2_01_FULL_35_10]